MNTNCRRRIRSTIKWSGAVLTVLLLIAWVGTRWCSAGFHALPTIAATLTDGQLRGGWYEPWSFIPRQSGGYFMVNKKTKYPFQWWFETQRSTVGNYISTRVFIPIWFLILLTAVPTYFIWRSDSNPPDNVCPKCGYSRTGLPEDRACPECGAANSKRGGKDT